MEKEIEKVILKVWAKDKIKSFIKKYPNSIYNNDLEDIQKELESENKSIVNSKISIFLKNYGNITIKGEIGEALYELINIFQDIDKNNEEEA